MGEKVAAMRRSPLCVLMPPISSALKWQAQSQTERAWGEETGKKKKHNKTTNDKKKKREKITILCTEFTG